MKSGLGTVKVGNGVFEGAYSYGSGFGEEEETNPERLIAAAQAACFTMVVSSILSAAGHEPESVRTNARVHLRNIDGAPMLARINLDTEAHVPTTCRWSGKAPINYRSLDGCVDRESRTSEAKS